MSKWRKKAKSVRKQGEIERRDWNPQPGSVHLRMYQWWQTRSSRAEDISRENFCHYWRVVMIWVPLRWVWPKLLVLLGIAAAVVLIAAIFVYGNMAAIGVGAGLYLCFCATITGYLADKFVIKNPENKIGFPVVYEKINRALMALLMLVALPGVVAITAIVSVIGAIVYAIKSLHQKYDAFAFLRVIGRGIKKTAIAIGAGVAWVFAANFSDSLWLTWIRPYLAIPTAFAILGFWHTWAFVPAIIICGIVVIVMVILGLSYLADEASIKARDKRDAAKKAEWDVFFHNLFALQHPKHAGNETRYQDWFERYRRHIKNVYGEYVYNDYASFWLLFDRNEGLERKYFDAYGELRGNTFIRHYERKFNPSYDMPKKKRRSGVIEFLAFVWSVVLVNKWKICPIVEIPEKS